MLHMAVIRRMMRQNLVTVGGKIVVSIMMTHLLTWNDLRLNLPQKIVRNILSDIPVTIILRKRF